MKTKSIQPRQSKYQLLLTFVCMFAITILPLYAQNNALAGESATSGEYRVERGERPPINFNEVSEDAFHKGVLIIKFKTAYSEHLEANPPTVNRDGQLSFQLEEVDQLNSEYRVTQARQHFLSPALNNTFTERHKAWGFHLWYVLDVDENTDIRQMREEYSRLAAVEIAEPSFKKVLYGSENGVTANKAQAAADGGKNRDWTPNDPMFNTQWHYHNTGQQGGTAGADIDLLPAWDIEKGHTSVVVAIIDDGIQFNHIDLYLNMWQNTEGHYGYNFVDDNSTIVPGSHGTHVAGTVAAMSNNGTGVAGIAGGETGLGDGVRLMSCQIYKGGGGGTGLHLAPVYAADNGAAISQNSWGYYDPEVYEQNVLDAIDYFNTNGGGDVMSNGITIFAAGNSNWESHTYPAYYSGAMAVAASNNQDAKSWYSNYGDWIDISAPGGETDQNAARGVRSTTTGSNYAYNQGTSMACPHVSGVVALLVSYAHRHSLTLDRDEVWDFLVDNVDDHYPVNHVMYAGKLGSGRLNANLALSALADLLDDALNPASFTATSVNSGRIDLDWQKNADNNDVMLVWAASRKFGRPVNGVVYTAGQSLPGGGTVLYVGGNTAFEHTGLDPMTGYYYKTFSVHGSNEYSIGLPADANTGIIIPANGNGEMASPYEISQLGHLRWLALETRSGENFLNKYFIQTQDIDASPTANASVWGAKGFDPIGGYDIWTGDIMPFAGTYDGQGYAIDGLFMAHPDEMNNGVGLFNHTDEEAVIKNLHLTNVDVSAFWDVGALVGRNRGLIDNCYASGKVEGIANSVGGLAGYNNYDGIITNSGANMTLGVTGEQHVGGLVGNNDGQMTDCHAEGIVNGVSYVGGLIGTLGMMATLSNSHASATVNATGGACGGLIGSFNSENLLYGCYATGDVAGSNNVGGLIGSAASGGFKFPVVIDECYASGNVSGSSFMVGGLVGYLSGVELTNAYATGNVTADLVAGGLVGSNEGALLNCWASGNILTTNGIVLGGLAGENWGTIHSCFAKGHVSGENFLGGLIGENLGEVQNSFARGDVSGNDYVGGFIGYHTNYANITDCFSSGVVSYQAIGGGFLGFFDEDGAGLNINCYWDVTSSVAETSPGGAGVMGRTMAQMTYPYDASAYQSWDFTDVWAADADYEINDGYPYLINNDGVLGRMLGLTVFLEGAFDGTEMASQLNTATLIPLQQPYNTAPWNHTGTEEAASIPAAVVDWVLVELRDADSPENATSATNLTDWPKAMFLKNDGSLVDLDGNMPDIGNPTVNDNLYIVVRHRNHLDVMSSAPLTLSGITYTYDFTDALTKAHGGAAGYKEIGTGVFGMVAGDIDADGSITVLDFSDWASAFGITGTYNKADADMDGQVSVLDFSKWAANFGIVNPLTGITKVLYEAQIP